MINKKKGFTLLELIVVMVIISIATALIMPSFWSSPESALKSEAKHISSTMRYLYNEAAGKKKVYQFNVNPEDGTWGFESSVETKAYKIRDDVAFKDVLLPSNGELTKKRITLNFGPLGPEEPIVLHLTSEDNDYTVIFNHLNGRSRILEGYVL
jgi:general secretion pathway protein H